MTYIWDRTADPLNITPVWLYWLDIDDAKFEEFEARSTQGRDGWESGWTYAKVPIQHDSWRDLRNAILHATGARRMSADPELGLRVWFHWVKEFAVS
jgi:hypothetical protein